MEYDDVAPWPTTPDGTGPSLTRASQFVYGHEPTNWSGAGSSPGSVPLPAPPSNLAAVSTAPNRIHLSWDDNSTDEVGFKVERLENSDWIVIATLGANVASYDDTRLQSRRLYEYRVRAYHDVGDGLPTNVASAETQQLQQLTGTSGNDVYHLVRVGDQVRIYENEPPTGTPSYSSDLAQLSTNITLFTLAGNDTVNVSADPGMSLGSFIQWIPGPGANALNLTSGSARFSIEMQAGDQLTTNVSGGSHLTVWGFRDTALRVDRCWQQSHD